MLTLDTGRHDLALVAAHTVLLSCRALVYGLARMVIDGQFPEWQPKGNPRDWSRRSLAQFIEVLRRREESALVWTNIALRGIAMACTLNPGTVIGGMTWTGMTTANI